MKSKIIGNGMFANAFKHSISNDCVFFCSGVSKSTETRVEQFEREMSLLCRAVETANNKCFVYFSSVLALFESNEYYVHKRKMENLVALKSKSYLILRLPQVAGRVINDTLLPNFIKNIYLESEFEIYQNAPRTIVDIDDVVMLFDLIRKEGIVNQTLVLCPDYSFQPIELVRIISERLRKIPRCHMVERSSFQHCESSTVIKKYDYIFGSIDTYLERVVIKYLPGIVDEIKNLMTSKVQC